MPEVVEDELTAAKLVELLADAGEIDAGVEVLEAFQLRSPSGAELLRLQARLFSAEDVPRAKRRAVLKQLRPSALDALARQGALIESAVAYRVLASVFPEEPLWLSRLGRLEAILAPLPNPDDDPARASVDALLARGAVQEALAALRDLVKVQPDDRALDQRAEELRGLLFDPTHTRPFRALTSAEALQALEGEQLSMAERVEQVRRSLKDGALERALKEVTSLAQRAGSPQWIRLRDALQRLVEGPHATAEAQTHSQETFRLDPVATVDLWVRQGLLEQAREVARAGLAASPSIEVTGLLTQRLGDLDVVLDGTLPTPAPPRPSSERAGLPGSSPPVEVRIVRPTPEHAFPASREEPVAPVVEPAAPVGAPSPPPSAASTPSPPEPESPGTGNVKVARRKIVRLR